MNVTNCAYERAEIDTEMELAGKDAFQAKADKESLIIRALSKLTDSIEKLSCNINVLTTRITHIEKDITCLKENHTKEITENGSDWHAQNAKFMDSVQEINDIVLNEKRANMVKEKCQNIKQNISLIWQETLNTRKQACWNSIHNYEKANLYEEWSKKSPNFIPLKYRPKRIENELPEITSRRISEAKLKYRNDIDNMRTYAQRHIDKTEEMDDRIALLIENSSEKEEERNMLNDWWSNDAERNSTISLQLWQKRKKFLVFKKNEEELNGNQQLTDRPWQKTIKARCFNKTKETAKNTCN